MENKSKIAELTKFDLTFSVDFGGLVQTDEDGKEFVVVGDNKTYLPEDSKKITIRNNKVILDRFQKYANILFSSRGLKFTIDKNDNEVKEIFNDWVKNYQKAVGKHPSKKEQDKKQRIIIEQVEKKYKVPLTEAYFSIILWLMFSDGLFKNVKRNGFETTELLEGIEIPDEYWTREVKKDYRDPYDDLLQDELEEVSAMIDRSSPLEMMIGYVMAFSEEYKELIESLGEIISFFTSVTQSYVNEEVDEAGFLSERIDAIKSGYMVAPDNNDE